MEPNQTSKKKVLLKAALGLAAVVAAPAGLYTGYDYWKAMRKPSAADAASVRGQQPQQERDPAQPQPAPVTPPKPGLEGASVRNLTDVLNFNVTPGWVMQRWPRVSTGLAHLQLQGYRVPLVTGTAESDLAGSLTYYFNAQQQVQRITFCGTTGDSRKLADVLTGQFHLTRRLTNDPGLMVYEGVQPNGKPSSGCSIRLAPVVTATDANRRFQVDLVLERPM
jgi:hypothetical protein